MMYRQICHLMVDTFVILRTVHDRVVTDDVSGFSVGYRQESSFVLGLQPYKVTVSGIL
jgi:hypothetical protein